MSPMLAAVCLILTQSSALALMAIQQQYPDGPMALPADDSTVTLETAIPPGCGSDRSGYLEEGSHSGSDWAWWADPHHKGTVGFIDAPLLGSDSRHLVVYNLGCGNGIQEIRVVKNLMRRVSNFTMVFLDLRENKWGMARASLQSTVRAVFPEQGAYTQPMETGTLVGDGEGGAVGMLQEGNIYAKVAPPNSVDLMYSSHAVSYLSNPSGYQRPTAELDWEDFLLQREKELKPGGWLFVTGMAALKGTYKEGRIWVLLNEVLNDAVKANILTKEERLEWRSRAFPRNKEAWEKPFKKGVVRGLTIEKFEIEELNDPFWVISGNDACAFARSYVDRTMTWLGNYLGETTNENMKLYFKSRLTEDVQRHPRKYHRTTLVANLAIKKLSSEELAAIRA